LNTIALGGAFIAGIAATGHCLAMCGGISVGIAASARGGTTTAAWPLLASLGRIASYALAGALVGAFGAALGLLAEAERLRFAGQLLSGIALLLLGLRQGGLRLSLGPLDRVGAAAWRRLAPLTRRLMPARTPWQAFAVGMLWGWLPCGMSYGMLALAATTLDPWSGAAVMAAFGLGTLPSMMAAGSGARLLAALPDRALLRRLGAIVLVLAGLAALTQPWWGGGHAHHHGGMASQDWWVVQDSNLRPTG
jgi:uncharacterized protein